MLRCFSTIRIAAASLLLAGGVVGGSGVHAADQKQRPEFTTGSSDVIIQEINRAIRQKWKDDEVEPSPLADDYEWLRRVELDVVGHIPSLEEVESFAADKDKAKRTKVIDR